MDSSTASERSPAAAPVQHPAPPSVLVLAWRQLWRDWRAGELRLLSLALVLAVAAVTAVGFLSERMEAGLRRDAAQLLGGDALVASDRPIPPSLQSMAETLGLRRMHSVTFPSMARAASGNTRLVTVKSVSASYPLRGQVLLADGRRVGAPAPGEVWVDAPVLDALDLAVGSPLLLGDSSLKVAGVILNEPDRGAGFLSFAPRLMLNEADLAATGLVQPSSRVTYRMAVLSPAADGEAAARFMKDAARLIEGQGLRGLRLENLESGRPEMRQTLDRASLFLRLVAMLAALLAAVAISLASRDFALRHLDDCAMLRVLGQSQARIARLHVLEFAMAGLAASAVGVLGGLLLHEVFVRLLAGLMSVSLPPPGWGTAAGGMGLGLSLMLGFGLGPVLQLASVPPLRVLRRDLGGVRMASGLVLVAGLAGFAGLLALVAGDWKLGLGTAGGFALALGVFALGAWLVLRLLRRAVPQAGAPRWLALATRQISARPGFAVVQVSALGIGLLSLALLLLLRTDLINSWRAATPRNAPDRFVINIQPEQAQAFRSTLDAAGVTGYDWYPMIRGRLVTLNGAAVKPEQFKEERTQRLVEREFNLSHSDALPPHNQLAQGTWVADEADGLSVEQGLARDLGLKLGDRLGFDVAGQTVEARITSIRKLDWSSMRVNFFVLFPQREMADLPRSYITAFRAPAAAKALDKQLARDFPNITAVDVRAQLDQVQQVLDQVASAVQVLFVFTLAVGLIVLLTAVSSTREARMREFALMRALGAGSGLLGRVQRAELLGLGLLAGVLAGGAALLIGAVLAAKVFDFSWTLNPWLVPASGLAGALLAWLAGWWGLRGVLSKPVMQSLRLRDLT
ncbi:ABC transporter permease [Pelomonas sp. APW6]|uniref:ABC transporter permease n=1 Tax=Roseateles subflavus TaxID=3053353 RepID=A0ABT7LL32_9BURK|nr:FtsX-like permease family protein [Pelomonas sp. APW6]MDL5033568.1 ABC transporter permease [Pelomonas sp. APW6]